MRLGRPLRLEGPNEAAARLVWPHTPTASTIGRTVATSDGGRTVVGVIEDIRFRPGILAEPTLYVPITAASARERPGSQLTVILRMAAGVQPQARDINSRLDTHFPPGRVRIESVEAAIEPVFRRPRLLAVLFGTLAGIALLLSGVGVYAITRFEASRRQHEMAVRVALGNTPAAVTFRLLLVTLRPVALGTAVGLLAVWWASAAGIAVVAGMAAHTAGPYVAASVLMLGVTAMATSMTAFPASHPNIADLLRER